MSGRTQVRRRAPLRAATTGLAVLAMSGSLAGCFGTDDARTTSSDPTVETSPTVPTEPTESSEPSQTPTPSPTPTSATPMPTLTPSPTATIPPAPALTTRLLPARSVVGLNDGWRWRNGETLTGEPTAGQIAACIRFSLTAIGAAETAVRSYAPPASAADAPASAVEVVARFADTETAVRVMEVLRSWQRGCQHRLNATSDRPHRVSQAEAIDAGDDAFGYLHSTPGSSRDTTQFEDVAQVRRGQLVALVVVRLDEQDYNYEPQRSPAARSLAAAAARLG